MATWVDVLIPGVIGLLLVAAPQLFARPRGDLEADARRIRICRALGSVALVAAGLYLLVKLMM
jgi:hypothetical protein